MKSTYIALFLIIIWSPFQYYIREIYYPLGSGFIPMSFLMIALLNEVKTKSFYNRIIAKPYIYWMCWILFAILNTFILNSYSGSTDKTTFIYGLFEPLVLILLISNEKYSIKKLINVFILSFTVRIILSFIFDGIDSGGRLGLKYNANGIAFGALILIAFVMYKKHIFRHFTTNSKLLISLAFVTIILTSSRKTLIALLILYIGNVYIHRSKDVMLRYLKYFLFISILFVIVMYLLSSTTVGNRFLITFYKSTNTSDPDLMFDGRMGYYTQAFSLFKENPINGVGLSNFGTHSIKKAGVSLHTEYMVQLAEMGIIGTLFWLLFYGSIISKIRSRIKYAKDKHLYELSLIVMLSIFFIMFGAWIYNMSIMFILIGFIIRLTNEIS